MDYLRNFARRAFCSGVFGAGLLGMYLAHKKRIPDYMGFASCWTCLYALAIFMIEDEESDDKDKEIESYGTLTNIMDYTELAIQNPESTSMAESAYCIEGSEIERRTFLNDFEEETNKVLANIEKLSSETDESTSAREIFINSSDFAFDQNTPEEILQLLNRVSEKLGEIKAQQEGIVIHISPLKLEKLDLKVKYPITDNSETALSQYVKDIIHELRIGDVSATHTEKTG